MNPTSAHYVRSIATEKLLVFNTHFGQGNAGTLTNKYLQPSNIRCLKGLACWPWWHPSYIPEEKVVLACLRQIKIPFMGK
jgi:hypothetical protein